MIDETRAREIADAALHNRSYGPEVVLGPHTGDVPGWWVFNFNTPEFWQTGDFAFAVIGAGPIAVSKLDGHVDRLRNTQDPMADLATRPLLRPEEQG